jgi:hypothetical protein
VPFATGAGQAATDPDGELLAYFERACCTVSWLTAMPRAASSFEGVCRPRGEGGTIIPLG